MPPNENQPLVLTGAAGRIEAVMTRPAGTPRGVAVFCHPHPLYGGALSNKVVYTLAACAREAGVAALRFNFRGVGASEGAHDHGRGETEDTLRVVAWARGELPGLPLVLGGFSFGAFVSLKASAAAQPALQISIAPPFKYFADEPLPARPAAPWLVVHGRDDEVVPFAETAAALRHYAPPPELVAPDGVGHFFHGRLAALRDAVAAFLAANLGAA